MKMFLSALVLLSAAQSLAAVKSVDCGVSWAMDEDIVRIREYRTVRIDGAKLEATIGGASYDQAEGAVINQTVSRNSVVTVVTTGGGEESFIVSVNTKSKTGTLFFKAENQPKAVAWAGLRKCVVK